MSPSRVCVCACACLPWMCPALRSPLAAPCYAGDVLGGQALVPLPRQGCGGPWASPVWGGSKVLCFLFGMKRISGGQVGAEIGEASGPRLPGFASPTGAPLTVPQVCPSLSHARTQDPQPPDSGSVQPDACSTPTGWWLFPGLPESLSWSLGPRNHPNPSSPQSESITSWATWNARMLPEGMVTVFFWLRWP